MATGSELWRPYSGFLGSLRKLFGPLLSHLTCGNGPYIFSPSIDGFIRYLIYTPLFIVVAPFVAVLFLSDYLWLQLFWLCAINKRYHDFWFIERRIKLENFNAEISRQKKNAKRLWRYQSPIADALFSYLISIMYYLQYYIPNTRHLYWHFATRTDMELAFREYLTRHPPAHPVTANDISFFADDPTSPFQVLVVNVCERLSYEEVYSRARQWAESDQKLQAVTSTLCGRPAWEPLPSRAELTTAQTAQDPGLRTFQLENHLQTVNLDLAQIDLNEYLSGVGSLCLNRNQPLWKLFIIQPTGPHPVDVRVRDETTNKMKNVQVPADKLTFMTFVVHHSLGDGAGMVNSVVEAFFDPLDHKLVLGTHTWRTSAFFYVISVIQAIKYVLSMLVFLLFWVPRPPTLLTKDGKLMKRRPNTGRKALPPPSIIDLSEIRRVKKQLTFLMPNNRKMKEPTINDIVTYCLTSACYTLRNSSFAEIHSIATQADQRIPPLIDQYAANEKVSNEKPILPGTDHSQIPSKSKRYHHRYASHFEDYMQLCLPMSVRTGMPTGLDNFTSVVLTRLPMSCLVGGESEREKTLAALKAVVDELNYVKTTNHRGLFFSIIYLMYSTLPNWLVNLICERCALMCQIILTNVRASETELTFCGKKVLAIHSWAPGHEAITTAVKLLTYKGDLQILATIDDIEWMTILSEEEYANLSQKEKIALSSVLAKLIVAEFQKLKHLVDSS